MKAKPILFTAVFIIISFYSQSQCSVNIVTQGSTTFCSGDSVILSAVASGASVAIDQSQLNYNAGTSARNLPGYSIWQSFTTGMTGTLTQINIGMFTNINGVGLFEVFQGTGTTGILLSSQTASIFCSGGNCMIPFYVNIPVSSGMDYTFSFTPGNGIPDPYGVQAENPGTYSGGYFAIVDPSGTYNTGFDMVFQTYVNEISYLWSNNSTDTSIIASASGTYSVTITTPGCTSSDNTNVSEIIVNTSVSVAGTTLTADLPMATYQWINCNGNTSIAGESNQSYTATTNGNYAVIITTNGCSDTSNCYNIATVGINKIKYATDLSIFPNPSEGKFSITKSEKQSASFDVKIINVLGEIIYSNAKQNLSTEIDLTKEPSGIYFIYIISDNSNRTFKLMKE